MDLYHYHPETGEYLGMTEARESPREPGVYLVPAYATTTAPPSVDENQIAVWTGTAWVVRDDFRGTVYWTDPETSVEIDAIGDTVPAGATTTPPPTPEDDEAVLLTDGEWQVVPDLRGTVYWTADGTRVEITEINVTVPAGASLTPPPSSADVNAERDRRLKAGKGFTPTGHGAAIHVNILDEPNLTGLATVAIVQTGAGNGSDTVQWRDNEDTLHTISYDQVIELHALAAAYKQAVYGASWTIKALDPIPADYADDSRWPAA